ncbi:hypothetical protein [Gordonia polyisoprenivorans]|uniref:hypothetical protein n=1 Tax=Gordonia polyisoprenivorans TaxID=84595 RepID=UPI0020118B6D|nr:hypothetical protein [Gordonia polyisoprenivorans]
MTGEWTAPEDLDGPDPSAPDPSAPDPSAPDPSAPEPGDHASGHPDSRPASGPTTDRLPVADGLPRPPITERRPSAPNWNRITAWEVVGYTVAIVFLAAVALGVFDIMLPWTAS